MITSGTFTIPTIGETVPGFEMWAWTAAYVPAGTDLADLRLSPLLAKDFKGLPPAFVLTAGFDPLLDEGQAYADRLAQAGVAVEYRCYEDMVHGFILMGGVLDTARVAVADCAARLPRPLPR